MQSIVAKALLTVCLLLLLRAGASAAGLDIFLKVEGIPGDSRDYQHQNEIDVVSFLWGEPQAISGVMDSPARSGSSTSSLQYLTIFKRVDSSSGKLFQSSAARTNLSRAVLTLRKGVGKVSQKFLKITLSDILVISYHVETSTVGNVFPMETVTFRFGVIEMEYRHFLPNGSLGETIKSGWDFRTNKKTKP